MEDAKKQHAAAQKEQLLAFKRQYERDHPEKAERLKAVIPCPLERKQMLEWEARCLQLEKTIASSYYAESSKKELFDCTRELGQQKKLLLQLNKHNPELVQRMRHFIKAYRQERELRQELDISR